MSNDRSKLPDPTRRRFMGQGAALGAMVGLGGMAGGAVAQSSAENGVLTARIYADISNLDPAFWTSAVDALVMRAIYALKSLWQLKRASLDDSGSKDYWQAGKSVAGVEAVEPAGEIVERFAAAARERLAK